jgi:DNA-binding CsgD family transcriptional regulator
VAEAVADAYVLALGRQESPLVSTSAAVRDRHETSSQLVTSALLEYHGFERAPIVLREAASRVAAIAATGVSTIQALDATQLFCETALRIAVARQPSCDIARLATLLWSHVLQDLSQSLEVLVDYTQPSRTRDLIDREALADVLTAREAEVFQHLANRASSKQIAATLDVSVHTVKHHVTSIGRKLDASGRESILHRARVLGLLVSVPVLAAGSLLSDVASTGLLT